MSEKATFTLFETTGGAKIHRIPLEAFPNFWAYVYIVQKNEYCVLIDTGSGADTSHENLLSGLHTAGIGPSDLTHILLTHAHIDHYGGLMKLRPITNAKIGCHELDLQTVAHHEARLTLTGKRLASFLPRPDSPRRHVSKSSTYTVLPMPSTDQSLLISPSSPWTCGLVPLSFSTSRGIVPVTLRFAWTMWSSVVIWSWRG